jgi:two-component system, chemotaxis family, sensor kinase CheA
LTDGSGLQQFVSAYVVEAEEHLETATSQLLGVENALRTGGANLKGIREAFRALHTIKGLSAMVGVEPVVGIAHRMESVLRAHDRQATKLPLESLDVLFSGLKAMRAQIDAFGAGKAVPSASPELVRALDALDIEHSAELTELPPLDLQPALAAKLGVLEQEQLREGLNQGRRALRVDFTPTAEKSARGVTITQVREKTQQLAEIVKVFPISSPGAPGSGLAFTLILLTSATDAEIAEAASADPDSVHVLAEAPTPALAPAPASAPMPELDRADDDLELSATRAPQRGVVRVDVSRLDETVEGLSALIVTRFRLARAVKSLREKGVDTRELDEIVNDNGRQLKNLRSAILRVRMVPVAEVLDRIPLIVRSLRRTMDRKVRLELEPGGAELDKAVAERVFPALVHLIRNAVDHAIETPDERARRGKPEDGLVRVECSASSNRWLELRVIDDGRGIDAVAVAQKAQAPTPTSDDALLGLICRSGLSTRDVATTVSGRGMGMEIVQRILTEQLGGELSLHTELGRGTTFTLKVPLSISVIDAFSFMCAGQRFVTPVGTVDEIVEVDPNALVGGPQLSGGAGVKLVKHRGKVVPLLSLAEVFEMGGTTAEKTALIVRRGTDTVAFGIDRMLGQQEVVVRPLSDDLVKVPGVSGATDLGDGRPTLVLDLFALGARLSATPARLESP